MFEIERLRDKKGTDEGIKYRLGGRGDWTEIDQAKTDKMRRDAQGLLYRVDIPTVWDIYIGLDAMYRDKRLVKLKVLKKMVREQVYDFTLTELPPEEEVKAEA